MNIVGIRIITIFPFLFWSFAQCQDFLNNDLEGLAGMSALPENWLAVPHTDPVCIATDAITATPDLLDMFGPIMGNPYSGNTFVSGILAYYDSKIIYQEGIMQEVSGFFIGQQYSVGFYQTVVKQEAEHMDSTGSWAVYMDNTLIGISVETMSQEPAISTNKPWEFRSLPFTATSSTHMFKFLPEDLDEDGDSTLYGRLRMGIDSIYIALDLSSGINGASEVLPSIYPNPSNGSVVVKVDHMDPIDRIEVMDLSGRVLYSRIIASTEEMGIDLSFLCTGTYLLRTSSKGVNAQCAKLLLERP